MRHCETNQPAYRDVMLRGKQMPVSAFGGVQQGVVSKRRGLASLICLGRYRMVDVGC